MADEVPLGLKQADINLYKTATRAAQLQTVKPIIAYWCEYWVVNQILAKQLHNTDTDILNYTTTLMDRLEQIKSDYASEEAITDDATGQAYVEQFAQETLDRAERVIKANKVTQNTATTFDAALTFLNLVNIWGPPDTETLQKIKYAKWNAARIIRAIKEGKDPNESNPKKEELQEQPPALDPMDPEVQMFGHSSSREQGPRPVSVEDVPDADLPRDAAGVSLPHSPASAVHPPLASDDGELKLPDAPGYGTQQPSYFDPPSSLPSPLSPPSHDPVNHNAPPSAPAPTWSPTPPPSATPFPPPTAPSAPATESLTFAPSPQNNAAFVPPLISPPPNPSFMDTAPAANVSRPVIPLTQSTATPDFLAPSGFGQAPQQAPATFTADDISMAQAQKHAKWAISALNFEDVPTAVRELRRALETLGAT